MPSKIISNIEVFDTAFLKRVERLSLQANRWLPGGLSGEHPSRRHLPAPTFSDHRPYTPGDDFRHVDWNAYARQEELYLKLGETEQDVHVIIAIDCSASLDWGNGVQHKGLYVLRLAALLGSIGLASNDHIQVWPFNQRRLKPFGPATGRGQTPALLRYLQTIPFKGETRLASLTKQLRSLSGGVFILISDLWHADDLAELLKTVAPTRWQSYVLHTLHPMEIKPELDGAFELEDSETGQLMALTIDQSMRQDYYRQLVAWVRSVERACREHKASYIGVRTDRALEETIMPLLRRRRLLG